MVVNVIDVEHLALRKAENDPPIRANRGGPKTFQVAFEGVKAEAGQIHIRGSCGGIEPRENVTQLLHVLADHAARVVVFIKTPEAFVADRANQSPP